jgi:hypothetical protein
MIIKMGLLISQYQEKSLSLLRRAPWSGPTQAFSVIGAIMIEGARKVRNPIQPNVGPSIAGR